MKAGEKYKLTKQEVIRMFTNSGPGIPRKILDKVAAAKETVAKAKAHEIEQEGKSKFQNLLDEPFNTFNLKGSSTQAPEISDFSIRLNLDEYDFQQDEEEDENDPVTLDVTALDRYNDDVRKYRHALLEECRLLPQTGEISLSLLERIRASVVNLCRTCYYGTVKAQKLADSSTILIVWLLNRRNLPIIFHIRMLQSLAEMIWSSYPLKMAVFKAHGVKVVIRLLRAGMQHHPNLACWSAYVLLAISIGNAEVIAMAQDFKGMDEFVAEIAFESYWKNWPANFGVILQGIIFGPHSVSPVEEGFEFL